MCGISGAFAFSSRGESFLNSIQAANETLKKRGPDGGAIFTAEAVVLGHRRLSIIDVSCAGDQPMHSHDGRYTIIFNGEIFNYKELQKKYLTNDEQRELKSHSDTEVFLFIYTKLGVKTFELLQGFFAAAIWDNLKEELVIARDRFGKKPVLYYCDEDKFLFASEMKALFKAGIPRKLNHDLLPVYFQLNYIPQPYSLIKGVQKLKPGHYITISRSGTEERPYYTLQLKKDDYGSYSYEEAQKKLVNLMDESVRMRLISDVPLGAFLSGGIDSSVIVALASRHTDKLNTFSIGYKDNAYFDETYYANLVAKKYNTEHTVFSLRNADFLEHINDVLNYIDEPFADSSAIPE
ncbi:MAG: asparagine synthase (glutamine-hydrolyzing), partial [Flavisolibacter sp.]